MRASSTDGVELEVHDLGGDGPDLLLVHATGFHGRVWEPLAGHLNGFHRWSVTLSEMRRLSGKAVLIWTLCSTQTWRNHPSRLQSSPCKILISCSSTTKRCRQVL